MLGGMKAVMVGLKINDKPKLVKLGELPKGVLNRETKAVWG